MSACAISQVAHEHQEMVDSGDSSVHASGNGFRSDSLFSHASNIQRLMCRCVQAFGLPNTSMITANLVNGTNNFLPQGNLTELIAGDSTPSPVLAATSAPLTSQVNSMTHRYAFGTAGYLEVWRYRLPFIAPCLCQQMQNLIGRAFAH